MVEVLWKTVLVLINHRIGSEVSYHDTLHEFREGRGKGTAPLEDNIIQHLTVMRKEVRYKVLLGLKNVHGNLDWERRM